MSSADVERSPHTHVHGSTIHNGPKGEAPPGSISSWMEEHGVAHTSPAIVLSLGKEENSATCYSEHELGGPPPSEISQSQMDRHHAIPLT